MFDCQFLQLRASKGQSSHPIVSQPNVRPRVSPPSEQHQKVQPNAPQLNASASSFVPEAASTGADEGSVQEGKCKPVILCLPLAVSSGLCFIFC